MEEYSRNDMIFMIKRFQRYLRNIGDIDEYKNTPYIKHKDKLFEFVDHIIKEKGYDTSHISKKISHIGGEGCIVLVSSTKKPDFILKIFNPGFNNTKEKNALYKISKKPTYQTSRLLNNSKLILNNNFKPFSKAFEFPYIKGVGFDTLLVLHKNEDKIKAINSVFKSIFQFHSLGLLHLDISPGNIIVNREHESFLIDYGISIEKNRQFRMSFSGKEQYASVNMLNMKTLGFSDDLESIGYVIYKYLFSDKYDTLTEKDKLFIRNKSILKDYFKEIKNVISLRNNHNYNNISDIITNKMKKINRYSNKSQMKMSRKKYTLIKINGKSYVGSLIDITDKGIRRSKIGVVEMDVVDEIIKESKDIINSNMRLKNAVIRTINYIERMYVFGEGSKETLIKSKLE